MCLHANGDMCRVEELSIGNSCLSTLPTLASPCLGTYSNAGAGAQQQGTVELHSRSSDEDAKPAHPAKAQKPEAQKPAAEQPAAPAASSGWSPALLAANRSAFGDATAHAASLIERASVQGMSHAFAHRI